MHTCGHLHYRAIYRGAIVRFVFVRAGALIATVYILMGVLGRLVWTIIWISAFIYLSGVAFTFFNVPPAEYVPYVLWVVALTILSAFLPQTITSVF